MQNHANSLTLSLSFYSIYNHFDKTKYFIIIKLISANYMEDSMGDSISQIKKGLSQNHLNP